MNQYILNRLGINPMLEKTNFRMVVVAALGAGIGYLTYELIYFLVRMEPRATVSWTLAFIIGVLRQHYLHLKLTFRLRTRPQASLLRAYLMYSMSALLGTMSNYVLVEIFEIHHRMAWLFCLFLTATISLILLKRWVFQVE